MILIDSASFASSPAPLAAHSSHAEMHRSEKVNGGAHADELDENEEEGGTCARAWHTVGGACRTLGRALQPKRIAQFFASPIFTAFIYFLCGLYANR
jgi:hypothetical protein